MSLRAYAQSTDERVIAGVCAGIARSLGVDPTLVRLVFALLALAGGAGILLYIALWMWQEHPWITVVGSFLAGCALLGALGLSGRSVLGVALIAGGLALAWRQGGSFRADAPLSYGGLALAAVGTVVLLWGGGTSTTLLAPGAVAGALLLIGGPWVWRLALERDAERTGRIRSEERADVAARVHDSVLQTLALIQKHADEPRQVAALARGRSASCAAGSTPTAARRRDGLARRRARGRGGRHRGAPRRAGRGRQRRRLPVDPSVRALVVAAREAIANAAKFAGVDGIDVYTEVTDGDGERLRARPRRRLRPRPPSRTTAGIAESIDGRMERPAAGRRSSPARGTAPRSSSTCRGGSR